MFNITNGKGFHITFANGYTISVQWGCGNYCDNYMIGGAYDAPTPESSTAEVAVWDSEGNWIKLDNENAVVGYCTPAQVAAFITDISSRS